MLSAMTEIASRSQESVTAGRDRHFLNERSLRRDESGSDPEDERRAACGAPVRRTRESPRLGISRTA